MTKEEVVGDCTLGLQETFPHTRCWGPALLGGWSQSRHAAQHVYRVAPLNTHVHQMLTVRHNLYDNWYLQVEINT